MASADDEVLKFSPRRSAAPARPTPVLRMRAGFRLQVVLIAALIALWEGVPLSLAGQPLTLSFQIYAVIMLTGTGLFIARLSRRRLTVWETVPFALIALATAVSAYYSTILSPQPLRAWLPAIYTLSPLLNVYALRAFGCQLEDVEDALYWAGFLGSLLLLVNNLAGLAVLESYVRGSVLGNVGKVVFFKLPAAFALMISMMRLINGSRSRLRDLVVMVVTGYNVFVASESRLVMVAFVITFVLVWLFLLRSDRKLFLGLLAPMIGVPLLWFAIGRFLDRISAFQGFDQYMAQDISASFRQTEIDFFEHYFDLTGGTGFGFMSGSRDANTLLSFATNQGGNLYGTGDYGLGLDDIGIYSAVFQYGWLGGLLVLAMTLMAIFSLVRLTRLGNTYVPVASLGFLMAGFMFSPISMNWFTLFYSGHIGGLLWFMAAEADRLRRQVGLSGPRRQAGRALPL